jgi:hypothetical protein
MGINSDAVVHILLVGPPASAKTMFRYQQIGEAASMTRTNQQKLHSGSSIIDYSIVRSRRRKASEIIDGTDRS